MSVYKRNGKYYVKGAIKRDDGTYYNYTKLAEGCTKKQDAIAYEVAFRSKFQDIQIATKKPTFAQLYQLFYKNQTAVKETTKHSYDYTIRKCIEKFGNKKINMFNKKFLQEYINELEKEFSYEYVSKIYYLINNVFKYAVQEQLLEVNPMQYVRRTVNVDQVKEEMKFWEPDEFNIFIEYVTDPVYRMFFMFQYYMGTRRGEALALQWKDVDFLENKVMIYKASSKTMTTKDRITTPKTSNSIRNISMPNILLDALKDWKIEQSKVYGFSNECYVFGFNKPLSFTTIQRRLDAGIKAANEDGQKLKRIRLHDFRHSHASYLINNMSDQFTDFDIAKRLGDTVETLHNTYAHWFKQADSSIIKVMNKNMSDNQTTLEQSKNIDFEQLKQLKDLLDMDIITQDEFNIKKKELLRI